MLSIILKLKFLGKESAIRIDSQALCTKMLQRRQQLSSISIRIQKYLEYQEGLLDGISEGEEEEELEEEEEFDEFGESEHQNQDAVSVKVNFDNNFYAKSYGNFDKEKFIK